LWGINCGPGVFLSKKNQRKQILGNSLFNEDNPYYRLREDRQMTYTGTLSGNRKGLPAAFKSLEGREEGNYLAMFEEGGKTSIHSWACNTKSGEYTCCTIKLSCNMN
jgi:hypothetical protein